MATRRPKVQTTVYEAMLAAGDTGLDMAGAVAAVARGEEPNAAHRMHAAKAVKALIEKGGAELAGPGRWRAIPGWVERRPNVPRLVDSGKLKEPVIGVDCTQEEYDRHRRARGRKAKPAEPKVIDPELLPYLTDDERARYRLHQARHNEDNWRVWIPAMFPSMASQPFGPFHEALWDHLWSIAPGAQSRPHIDVWGRGLGKSATTEMAVAALGCRRARKYVLYVSSTQTLADEHVESIATLLQSEMVQLAYPDMANPEIGKHGQARAWRRNRLRTASGFTVDALGLDVAARGKRIDEQRPDFIVLDDIDDTDDTPAMIRRKIRAITRKLLPTGAQDLAVVGVQNLVHPESIFARLTSKGGANETEQATFLSTRVVVGPIPAVYNLSYDEHLTDEGAVRWVITGGTPAWDGMPLSSCQHMIDLYGIESFLAECQHEEPEATGSMFADVDFVNVIRVREDQVPPIIRSCVWVDPAVSSTNKSDSCGIVADMLGTDRKIYRRMAWERIASPNEALTQAIRYALELGAEVVGVETDQGGDTWQTIYQRLLPEVVADWTRENDGVPPVRVPAFKWAKAGSSQLSKVDRANRMRSQYLMGTIKHVGGYVYALERGLKRFPEQKPYDVVDAAYWSMKWLLDHGGEPRRGRRVMTRAPRGSVGSIASDALA